MRWSGWRRLSTRSGGFRGPAIKLRSKRYYGQLRLPCRPDETSFPYIHPLPPAQHRQGPPVLSLMTSPACHPCYPGSPSVGSGSFRQDRCPSLPLTSTGSATPSSITRLHVGSLTLQPAGLLDSLTEPLSGNSVLQVTLNTSLQLRGRTAEFPRSDFNRQALRLTRHTDVVENHHFLSLEPQVR